MDEPKHYYAMWVHVQFTATSVTLVSGIVSVVTIQATSQGACPAVLCQCDAGSTDGSSKIPYAGHVAELSQCTPTACARGLATGRDRSTSESGRGSIGHTSDVDLDGPREADRDADHRVAARGERHCGVSLPLSECHHQDGGAHLQCLRNLHRGRQLVPALRLELYQLAALRALGLGGS